MSVPANPGLARQARELFVQQADGVLADLAGQIDTRLSELFDKSTSAREAQDRRDVVQAFQKGQKAWAQGTADAWRKAAVSPPVATPQRVHGLNLEIMDNEVVENKILSSRLALRILDKCSWEFNDLSLRMRALDGVSELDKADVLRPETLAQLTIAQWFAADLTRPIWIDVQDIISGLLCEKLVEAYHTVNAFLVDRKVMAEIDLRSLVKRSPTASSYVPLTAASSMDSLASQTGKLNSPTPTGQAPFLGSMPAGMAHAAAQQAHSQQGGVAAASQALEAARRALLSGSRTAPAAAHQPSPQQTSEPAGRPMSPGRAAVAQMMSGGEETRMLTSATPLSRARMRAQGVMGQLKRFITEKVAGFDSGAREGYAPSPQLAAVMASYTQHYAQGGDAPAADAAGTVPAGMPDPQGNLAGKVAGMAVVVEGMAPAKISEALKQQTREIKKAASTDAEKATIEIVALMFQAILAEDRIPSGIRVWFARLQMPVLRLALAEPEFFESLQHPARKLIDRMGSVVLGFEGDVSGQELETEIKRIVQVIEQYPETGRRVFQLVFDEFQKFLAKFLTNKDATQKIISVAQRVEEKETAAIQYTIELRKMLGEVPLHDEIRTFLFKVWAEVLAVASIKNGPQDPHTLNLKQAAVDLIWTASAMPSRQERAKVIEDLPGLLKRLRGGMDLLGLNTQKQDQQIRLISDVLAAAFMTKTQASVDQRQIEHIAKSLRNLEDFITEDDVGDLPLDAESIELILGIDLSGIHIITQGGTDPNQAMRAWAMEIEVGTWFTLDRNGKTTKVQYSWRSAQGQLHLFADTAKQTYLLQIRRYAAYLQAGLLTPIEDETLTVRATRAAMSKLDAHPERLLTVV